MLDAIRIVPAIVERHPLELFRRVTPDIDIDEDRTAQRRHVENRRVDAFGNFIGHQPKVGLEDVEPENPAARLEMLSHDLEELILLLERGKTEKRVEEDRD